MGNSIIFAILLFSLTVLLHAPLLVDAQSNTTIPEWIKNNAGWWASGQIDDDSFVLGIQYLIKEEIIIIPSTIQGSGSGSNEIPDWVRNNAGWWADGQIGDSDFVSGIQYLIAQGIMNIPQQNKKLTDCNELREYLGLSLQPNVDDGCYLVNANLSGKDLSGMDLRGADLYEADLSDSNLSKTNLSGAELYHADLSRANLSKTDLSNTELSGIIFSECTGNPIGLPSYGTLPNCKSALIPQPPPENKKLTDCNDIRESLGLALQPNVDDGCLLVNANLRLKDLSGKDLSGANLSDADLALSNFTGANLSGANLSGVFLLDKQLQQFPFYSIALSIIKDAGAGPADFSGANLSGANLSNSWLVTSILVDANLSGAYISGADFYGANLSGVNLSGANLSDTILSEATNQPTNSVDCIGAPTGATFTCTG